MIIAIIDKAKFKRMPWANGGGETTQLYCHAASDSDRFLWRISMAAVSCAGPFSHFDGYDRVLVLLEGHRLCLSYEGGGKCELRQRYDMAEFPGDIDTFATVSAGPVHDFNIIADRSKFKLDVSIVRDDESFSIAPNTKVVTVYSADGDALIETPNNGINRLPSGDLLVIENPEEGIWSLRGETIIVARLLSPDGIKKPKAVQ